MKLIYISIFLIFIFSCCNQAKEENISSQPTIVNEKKESPLSEEILNKIIEYKSDIIDSSKYSNTSLIYSVIFSLDTNNNEMFIISAGITLPAIMQDTVETIALGAFYFKNDYIVIFDEIDSNKRLNKYYQTKEINHTLLKELKRNDYLISDLLAPFWKYVKKEDKFVLVCKHGSLL